MNGAASVSAMRGILSAPSSPADISSDYKPLQRNSLFMQSVVLPPERR